MVKKDSKVSKEHKIAIVFYSLYGHIETLAKSIKEGAEKEGSIVDMYRVHETLSEDILKKMGAPPKNTDYPEITDPMILKDYDAIIFGISTRFGSVNTQLRTFFDSTGKLWASGTLVGKLGSFFFSTATQAGGQETAALTCIPFLAHHGMIYVPIGYTHPEMGKNDEMHGSSPYGAGTIVNSDGSRQSSSLELSIATHQGSLIAKYCKKFF